MSPKTTRRSNKLEKLRKKAHTPPRYVFAVVAGSAILVSERAVVKELRSSAGATRTGISAIASEYAAGEKYVAGSRRGAHQIGRRLLERPRWRPANCSLSGSTRALPPPSTRARSDQSPDVVEQVSPLSSQSSKPVRVVEPPRRPEPLWLREAAACVAAFVIGFAGIGRPSPAPADGSRRPNRSTPTRPWR